MTAAGASSSTSGHLDVGTGEGAVGASGSVRMSSDTAATSGSGDVFVLVFVLIFVFGFVFVYVCVFVVIFVVVAVFVVVFVFVSVFVFVLI